MSTTFATPRTTSPQHAGPVLRGRDMLCFSHDWTGDPLSKTHLMRLLARKNRVLWVNSIGYRAPTASKADIGRAFRKLAAVTNPLREVEPNLFVLSPLAVPAYGLAAIRRLNAALLQFQVRSAMRRQHAMAKWRILRSLTWSRIARNISLGSFSASHLASVMLGPRNERRQSHQKYHTVAPRSVAASASTD